MHCIHRRFLLPCRFVPQVLSMPLEASAATPLAGRAIALVQDGGAASAYAQAVIESLGGSVQWRVGASSAHPALRLAESGLLALTGPKGGAPLPLPLDLAGCADGLIAALRAVAQQVPGAPTPTGLPERGACLLAERAAAFGFQRAGAQTPGGQCRLLAGADGWLALNLARAEDWDLLPAWLEQDLTPDWGAVEAALVSRALGPLVERARQLGLAAAQALPPPAAPVAWYQHHYRTPNQSIEARERPLVIDLSALWAGPMCGHILLELGARVVKVESLARPDGARRGPPDFYHLLNAGKDSVALDFGSASGRAQLRALLLAADIVIEASRPRALAQLGIDAQAIIDAKPNLTWISLTGYGRTAPAADWVAFGDDAGVAAGLTHLLAQLYGQPLFFGDAIADPLTGLHAALLALCSFHNGGGHLFGLSLRDVVAHCIQFDLPTLKQALQDRAAQWRAVLAKADCVATAPRLRSPKGLAATLGAHTRAVLTEFSIPC